MAWTSGNAAANATGLAFLRALLHGSGYALWYSAVGLIPLATTAALSFTAPLFVTLGAATLPRAMIEALMWSLITAEVGGFVVLFYGAVIGLSTW